MVTILYRNDQEDKQEMSSQQVIERALKQLKMRCPQYDTYHAYYIGKQPLTYKSEKYDEAFGQMVAKYTENMCPAVVNAVADRLTVTGFSIEGKEDQQIAVAALDIWRRNRMDENAGKVHTEALKAGDSYVIVWPDVQDQSFIRIWPQDANGITCYYDEETNLIEWAAKWWLDDDKMGRLTLYFADRIERYITNSKVDSSTGFASKATAFKEYQPAQPNPYGRVPVFHFANNALIDNWGTSELKDVIPVQDGLNKAVCDMLVAMEFAAFPQRWATGLQVRLDPITNKPIAPWKPGIDRVWSTQNEDASFGQFQPADMAGYIDSINHFKEAVADISGTPQHYLQMASKNERYPSGEALKTAEARFVSKIEDRQISYGNTWEDVMTFALQIHSKLPTGYELSADWKDASPRTDQETATTGVLKKQLGVPQTQLWREMGYSQEDIDRMTKEKAEEDQANMERQQQLFQRGGLVPPGGPGA